MKHVFKRISQSAFGKLGVKAGLTLLAFWFVFRGIDFDHLRDMLHQQDHALLGAAIAFMLLQIVVSSFRWRVILNALSETGKSLMDALHAIKIYYISVFFTCCLPGTVGGDVVRVWLTKSEHVPLSVAIHSVIIDRIITLAALGVIIVLTLPVLGKIAGFNPAWIFAALLLLTIAGVAFLMNLERLIGRYRHIRVVNWVLYFLDSLRLILRRRTASIQTGMIAIATHTLYCLSAYFLAQSFHIQMTMIQCITLIPPVLLATTLPISIGGWGIREAGTIGMLGLIGVPQAQALMLSIQLGILVITISLPASILWLLYRKHSHQPIELGNLNATGSAQ